LWYNLISDRNQIKPNDKNNHLLRVLRIETDTNKIKMGIISDKIDRFIDEQKRENEFKNKLNNHRHKLVIQTGEPIVNNL